VKKFINEYPNRNWYPTSLNKLQTQIDQTGTVDCKRCFRKGKMRNCGLLRTLIQLMSLY